MSRHRHLLRIRYSFLHFFCTYEVRSCCSACRIIHTFNYEAILVSIRDKFVSNHFLLLPTVWPRFSTLHFHSFPLLLFFYLGLFIYYEVLLFLPGICESEIFWTNLASPFPFHFYIEYTLCFVNYIEGKHNDFLKLRSAFLLCEGEWRMFTAWCKATDMTYRFFLLQIHIGFVCHLFMFLIFAFFSFFTYVFHFTLPSFISTSFLSFLFFPCVFLFRFLHQFLVFCCDLFTVFYLFSGLAKLFSSLSFIYLIYSSLLALP
jgi:hypothetical protein